MGYLSNKAVYTVCRGLHDVIKWLVMLHDMAKYNSLVMGAIIEFNVSIGRTVVYQNASLILAPQHCRDAHKQH